MRQARISELRRDLSKYLAYVRRGGIVRIFDRDHAVAELVPLGAVAASSSDELDGILSDLQRRGIVRRGTGKLPKDFLTRPLPKCTESVVDALLDERRVGR